MVSSKPLSIDALAIAEETATRLDHWQSSLLLLGSGGIAGIKEDSFLGRELRAAAVVAALAEVEHVVREFLIAFSSEVNRSSTKIKDLQPGLRPLASHSNFDSLITTSSAEVAWAQRLLVTTLEANSEIARFPPRNSKGPQPPLDGKTIRPPQLLRLWDVLGIKGSPFPVPGCATSLNRLSSLRNDIAHRNVPIEEVFFQPDSDAVSLAESLDDIQLMILNMGMEFSNYASAKAFRI